MYFAAKFLTSSKVIVFCFDAIFLSPSRMMSPELCEVVEMNVKLFLWFISIFSSVECSPGRKRTQINTHTLCCECFETRRILMRN